MSIRFLIAAIALAMAIYINTGIAAAGGKNPTSVAVTTTPAPPTGVKIEQPDTIILQCDIDCGTITITSGHFEECILVCKTSLPDRSSSMAQNSNIFIIRENTVPNASITFNHGA